MRLNNVTLISIAGNPKSINNTKKALMHCVSQVDFDDVILFSCEPDNSINTIEIPYFDLGMYSQFCVEQLNQYIKTDFCMIIQWDGFILDTSYWADEFLSYDFIGAPWPFDNHLVGNGGFCIRSKKFLEVSSQLKYKSNLITLHGPKGPSYTPEDWFLVKYNREHMINNGINFAPADLAYQFSVEHVGINNQFANSISAKKVFNPDDISTYKSFGFHGDFNTAGMRVLYGN